ncbi:hypothetical protein [Paenibacillus sp. JNUCC31]|nr:hypothetical protein [Paenibacillus sp. JNUCC-31]
MIKEGAAGVTPKKYRRNTLEQGITTEPTGECKLWPGQTVTFQVAHK